MRIRFSIRDLLWLTVMVAGIVTIVVTFNQYIDAVIRRKPDGMPEELNQQLWWQFYGGLVFLIASTVRWLTVLIRWAIAARRSL